MWRSDRAFGPPSGSPLDEPPRSDVTPNANEAIGSVGPNVPTAGDPSAQSGAEGGYGATHVLYPAWAPPLQAQAWAGWPAEWAVPSTATGTIGGLPQVGTDIVWTCIDRNATAVADMPPYMTRGPDLVRVPIPPYIENPQPEVYSHWGEFVRQIWWSYQAAGEVFIMATSRYSDTDYPRTFLMVAPFLITPEIIDGQRRYFIGSEDVTRDVLHIRYASWPGDARGHGPLEAAGARLLAVRSLMRYGSDLAVNGGIPWAVLKHKYKLGATQANEMRAQWVQAAHDRAGAPAVLDLDTDLQVLQVSPKDMALSEMQQFAEARIAVLLGVPPYMVGLPSGGDSMTYNTQEGVYVDHWRRTLKPGSGYLMAALSHWLTPGPVSIRLNAASYIRPGDTDRAAYYDTMVRLGVLTAADVARMEELPPPAAAAATQPPSSTATLEVVA